VRLPVHRESWCAGVLVFCSILGWSGVLV
jgi:hypothetical protein